MSQKPLVSELRSRSRSRLRSSLSRIQDRTITFGNRSITLPLKLPQFLSQCYPIAAQGHICFSHSKVKVSRFFILYNIRD
jgi:hypothetical protein